MNKVKVLMLVLVMIHFGTQQVKAQSGLSKLIDMLTIGVKVEGNGASFLIKDNPSLTSSFRAGGAAGGMIRLNISNHFVIQEDILFVYHTGNMNFNGKTDQFEYVGTEVPIYLMGQWHTPSKGRFFIGAGPYVGLGITGKYKSQDIDVFKKYDGQQPVMKRISNGAAATIGYEFGSGLQLSAGYKYGLNMLDRDKDAYNLSLQTVSIGLGYNF